MSPIKVLEGSRVIRVIIKALSGRQNMVGEVELVGGITRAFGRDLGRQVVTNKVHEFPSNRGIRRENPQQDFQVVTAQQLLGAIQEMVRQVLGQGHHLPEQCLGDRPSF